MHLTQLIEENLALNKMIKRKKEELLDAFENLANPERNLEAAQEFF